MNIDVKNLLDKLKDKLTLDGRSKIFERGYRLDSKFLKETSDPEAFTKEFLIDPIIRKLGLEKLPEKHFIGMKGSRRKVDYILKNEKGIPFLLEAKSLNSDLEKTGAVNQIKGLFRLVEVRDNYQFGIATDGLKWLFIDKNSVIVYKLDLIRDFYNQEKNSFIDSITLVCCSSVNSA